MTTHSLELLSLALRTMPIVAAAHILLGIYNELQKVLFLQTALLQS